MTQIWAIWLTQGEDLWASPTLCLTLRHEKEGWSLEDAGLAGVRPKDDFTYDSHELVLICQAVTSVFFTKKNSHSTRGWNGKRDSATTRTPRDYRCSHSEAGAVVSLPGPVAAGLISCAPWLAAGLD